MRKSILIFSALCMLFLSSCKSLIQNHMLKTDEDFQFDELPETRDLEYKIAPNDVVIIRLFTNEGSALLNILNQTGQNTSTGGSAIELKVEFDGFINLPVVGRKYIAGLTVRQLEFYLEDLYVEFYKDPFVLVEVSNRRVYIFSEGTAAVVMLENDNTTIFEVLAKAGGIPENGKAQFIKLIRGDLNNPEVFLIDLSSLETLKNADVVMQSQDIIYIETRKNYAQKTLALVAPYFSILSTILLVTTLVVNNPFNR